jgi:hypothetical protein
MFVIPTGAGAPATEERRNLLLARATTKKQRFSAAKTSTKGT